MKGVCVRQVKEHQAWVWIGDLLRAEAGQEIKRTGH